MHIQSCLRLVYECKITKFESFIFYFKVHYFTFVFTDLKQKILIEQ